MNLWQRYTQLGITDALSAREARYVRALNGIVPIVTALLWLQLPVAIALLPASRFILAGFLIWPLIAQLVPFLNSRGRYTAARLTYSYTTLALIVFNALQLGPATENHLFMLSTMVVAFIIYPPRERSWLALYVLLSGAALLALEVFFHSHGPLIEFPPRFLLIARWSSMSALFTIILAITIYNYRVITQTEFMLEREHRRSEGLLLNILPASIAARLKRRETPIADRIDDASILFADIVGFTALADSVPHERVVQILDELFSEFDRIGARYGLEKIKTIGDAYMMAGGLPNPSSDHHGKMANAALDMVAYVRGRPILDAPDLQVRIGIHSGPVVAGVICERKFAYDVWGDTVNIASRMESHGEPNRIQVSAAFHAHTRNLFEYEARGGVQVKGKGRLETYLLAPALMAGTTSSTRGNR
jgi:adenylate cyclase